ncbi:MAG: hypothetical protein COB24_02935 [Hyphomicrobiales bacterium]|nr:MAG: hypothetical protein COB24_02935 [Hyphomicrobiales bacterium]
MSVQKPNGLNILLVVVFILAFMFVKSLNNNNLMPDMGLSVDLQIEVVDIIAITRPRLAYIIVPYDEYTGAVGATPFEQVYQEYDSCLVALFEKRTTMAAFKVQYTMSIKCDRPSI